MGSPTIDDVSSVASAELAAPAIVMIATGTAPASLVFAPSGVVELGRRIASGAFVREVDDDRMSRDHATVEWRRGGWRIIDHESRNGTFVDGERIEREVQRAADVVVRLGHTVFVLLCDGRGHAEAPHVDEGPVIGPELARTYDQIRRHVATDTLLIHGESGAGKELAARAYHDARTPGGPFVAVNCATIPEGVAERLLFGSRRGAFSGATDAVGYLQSAHGGTLFLDEIADLPIAVQAKLLRVLETRDVLPIGATTPIAIELGVVAASHRELRAAVVDQRFRDDLYYRLARAVVHVPPIRARKVDAARLVIRELAAGDRKLVAHAKLIEACCVRRWPGNIRELCAAVRQAAQQAIGAGREVVRADDLPEHAGAALTAAEPPAPEPPAVPAPLDKAAVVAALARANGVLSVAARALGLHRTQLYRLMDKLGIARDEA